VCQDNNFWTKRLFIVMSGTTVHFDTILVKSESQSHRSTLTVTQQRFPLKNVAKVVIVTSRQGFLVQIK